MVVAVTGYILVMIGNYTKETGYIPNFGKAEDSTASVDPELPEECGKEVPKKVSVATLLYPEIDTEDIDVASCRDDISSRDDVAGDGSGLDSLSSLGSSEVLDDFTELICAKVSRIVGETSDGEFKGDTIELKTGSDEGGSDEGALDKVTELDVPRLLEALPQLPYSG